ncbi:MAG: DUF1800 domain-containing protein [Planctomycetota bacterium]|jgi:uncharacterized protein (DUF1800 family)
MCFCLAACGGGQAAAPLPVESATLLAIEVVGRAGNVVATTGGEDVRIVGGGLSLDVAFSGTAAAAVRFEGEDAVVAVTPAMPVGVVDVTVGDRTLVDALEFREPPRVSALAAVDGPLAGDARASVDGDTWVEVSGTDLRPPLEVFVEGVAVVAGNVVGYRFLAPQWADEGAVDVEVRNADGLAGSAVLTYTAELSLAPAADDLDVARAHHLYRRAGFGGTPEEIARAVAEGLGATVARLVEFAPAPGVEAAAAQVYDSVPPREPINRRANQEWWLHLLLHNPNVLQERMALLWHDHFATSQRALKDATWFMYEQIQLFRREGLGNWRTLCDAVTKDYAMLPWLDGVFSTRERPNENFARELWERFMLGEGVGYTEADVKEAARAFTGFKFQFEPDHFVTIAYLPERHDAGEKTVFGVTGRFGYGGTDARDTDGSIVDLTLERRGEEAARFVCEKLAAHFLYPDPPATMVNELASQLRNGGWELRPVVERLLQSKALFSQRARRAQLKSPVEFVIGYLRATGIDMPLHRVNQRLVDLDQALCEPPSVAGWPEAEAFYGAQAMLTRLNFLNEAVSHVREPLGALLPDDVAERLDIELSPIAQEEMHAYLNTGDPDPIAKARGLLYMVGQYHAGYLK